MYAFPLSPRVPYILHDSAALIISWREENIYKS
jgi:hypothetical protein